MAGEVFVARQDTLESVKGTVEDIDTNLGTPDYAGGGTDVVAMIGALASAVTTLQSDIDSVKTAIAGMSDKIATIGSSEPKVKTLYLKGSKTTKSYKTSRAAIIYSEINYDYGSISFSSDVYSMILASSSTSIKRYLTFVPANTTVSITMTTSNTGYYSFAEILEL